MKNLVSFLFFLLVLLIFVRLSAFADFKIIGGGIFGWSDGGASITDGIYLESGPYLLLETGDYLLQE